MISGIYTSLSALHGFEKNLNVTADNTANLNTAGFKKHRVILSAGHFGGVDSHIQQLDSPGIAAEELKDGKLTQTETSNVDLSEEAREKVISQNGYLANLKMVKAQEESLGKLLNIIG